MRIDSGYTLAAVGAVIALVVAGCGVGSTSEPDPTTEVNSSLHDALPESVAEDGKLVIAMPGVNPPWWQKDGQGYTGAAAKLMAELGSVLDVKMEYVAVKDLAAAFAGVRSGRYDAGFNPYGDVGSKNIDVVDVIREIVPFLVPAGNPEGIESLDDLCGLSIAALGPAGKGSAYYILTKQSDRCTTGGEPPIDIVALKAVPDGVLAIKSDRADALFSSGAPLSYYVEQSDGDLELAATEADTGFENLYQGLIVSDRSPLSGTLVKAFEEVFDSGAYETIMRDHGLERQMLDEPGLNLATGK